MSSDLPNLPSHWTFELLDRCCKSGSVTYGIVQPGMHTEGGVPIIRVNNFQDTKLQLTDVMRVASEIAEKYKRTRLLGGEVLLTVVGTVGQVTVVPKSLAGYNVARAVAVLHPLPHVSADWIALCLRSPYSQHRLGSRANTTVQTTINLKDLRALPIPLPPIHERDAITKLVGGIDNSINNLQETNAALESITQRLFRSWFVNFDPVHAKAAGNAPEAMSAELAELFPSEFEESSLGLIPMGWGVTSFGDTFSIKGGATPSTAEPLYWNGGVHAWTTPKDMSPLKSKVIYRTERRITAAGLEKISSRILPTETVLMSSRAPVGYLAIAKAPISINQGFIAIPPTRGIPSSLIVELLAHKMPDIKANAGGTTFAEISKTQFRPIKWVRAPEPILNFFGKVAEPLYAQVYANCLLMDALSNLRDHLLPRLISGKLSIGEAEKAVAELLPEPVEAI